MDRPRPLPRAPRRIRRTRRAPNPPSRRGRGSGSQQRSASAGSGPQGRDARTIGSGCGRPSDKSRVAQRAGHEPCGTAPARHGQPARASPALRRFARARARPRPRPRLERIAGQAEACLRCRARFALRSGQAEMAGAVVRQHESGIGGAEHAMAVEQDDLVLPSSCSVREHEGAGHVGHRIAGVAVMGEAADEADAPGDAVAYAAADDRFPAGPAGRR